MADTDLTRLLDGYSLLAIKEWAEDLLALKAPIDNPTFTVSNGGHVTLPTSVMIGNLTSNGFVKYDNGVLSVDTNSYLTSQTWRAIQIGGQTVIAANSNSPLKFLNTLHNAVQFSYENGVAGGLYADVDLRLYKPNGTNYFLDSSYKIDAAYIPDSILGQLVYKSPWDASSTTGVVTTPSRGWYYICSHDGGHWPDGTAASGKTFVTGDWAIWTGSGTQEDPYRWEKVDNTDAISGIILVSGTALTGQVTIPLAASDTYGLIKIGYSASGKNYAVQLDANGKAYVYVPWTNTDHNTYHTPLFNNQNGVLDIATGMDSIGDIWIPRAGLAQYGVIKIGYTGITQRTYAVQLDSDGCAYVTVPWQANTDHYPTAFSWTNGTTAGPTGSLIGSNFTTVSFGAIPSASTTQSGVVTTGEQEFNGTKHFHGMLSIDPITDTQLPIAGLLRLRFDEDNTYTTISAQRVGNLQFALTSDNNTTITRYNLICDNTGRTYTIATTSDINSAVAAYVPKSLFTTAGDIIYASAQDTPVRLGIGSAGQVLTVNGGLPVWSSLPADKYHTSLASSGLKIATAHGSNLADMYVPLASTNDAGVVSLGEQSFAGPKTFTGTVKTNSRFIVNNATAGVIVNLHYDNPSSTSGEKNINLKPYTKDEAKNILRGLNSDGTARS